MTLVFAVTHLYTIFIFLLLLSIPFFFFYTFKKSGIDKLPEWSPIPACPSLMCFFSKANAEGTIFFIFLFV